MMFIEQLTPEGTLYPDNTVSDSIRRESVGTTGWSLMRVQMLKFNIQQIQVKSYNNIIQIKYILNSEFSLIFIKIHPLSGYNVADLHGIVWWII